jgi:mono/diheme cytochrome c family protein
MDWNRSVALVGAAVLGAALGRAQSVEEWVAPPEARALANALSATNPEHVKKGRSLFAKHCVTCHGDRGQGDGPAARLHARRSGYAPRDLSRTDVQARLTDGEIFWKIRNGWRPKGRVVMPGLGDDISDEDRWRLVIYVRSLLQKAGAR